MRRLFGTDGIRGRVGEEPIRADFAVRLGAAAGRVLARSGSTPRVLIGKDTRSSGYMLESALEAGLSAAGADAVLLGPIPTPAVAWLTVSQQADAGIVISASHNPYTDNGIKFFDAQGEKLPDAVEAAIEEELQQPFACVDADALGRASRLDDARGRYVEFLKSTVSQPALRPLRRRRVVIDCAHGAAYQVGPKLLRELNFEVGTIGVSPDGRNINAGVGATAPAALVEAVRAQRAWLGLALDGDGDRLLLVDAQGRCYDGDDLLLLLARHHAGCGRLRGPVVGTVMTNLAIERALQAAGIDFRRAAVGDRHVHQLLRAEGGVLGGEASGHLLVLDRLGTGDGLLSALQVLEVLAGTGRELSELCDVVRYPQRTVNLRLRERPAEDLLARRRGEAERRLGDAGRVVLRPSGTEPVLRLTVEAETEQQVEDCLCWLEATLRADLGLA